MSSMVMKALQQGHCAPVRDIVPAPSFLSCSRLCAALPLPGGTSDSTPKVTPVLSASGSIVNRTRFRSFLQSQRVLSSGTMARQFLHATVLAHRYATVGLPSITG